VNFINFFICKTNYPCGFFWRHCSSGGRQYRLCKD